MPRPHVALGDGHDEAQVGLDQLGLGQLAVADEPLEPARRRRDAHSPRAGPRSSRRSAASARLDALGQLRSSSPVSRWTRPISFRYMRTVSPVRARRRAFGTARRERRLRGCGNIAVVVESAVDGRRHLRQRDPRRPHRPGLVDLDAAFGQLACQLCEKFGGELDLLEHGDDIVHVETARLRQSLRGERGKLDRRVRANDGRRGPTRSPASSSRSVSAGPDRSSRTPRVDRRATLATAPRPHLSSRRDASPRSNS